MKFWLNMSMLAAESQRVIWLRMMKVSRGGAAAERETHQMVSEKVLAATVAAGRSARTPAVCRNRRYCWMEVGVAADLHRAARHRPPAGSAVR
jgi:hypothetical protein